MKKYLTLFISLFILGTLIITPYHTTQAAGGLLGSTKSHLDTLAGDLGFDTRRNADAGVAYFVGQIIKITLGMLGVVFMILTIYGGWLWMTAAGNEQRVEQAKNLLRDSIIGLIIIVSAFALTNFVTGSLTGLLKP